MTMVERDQAQPTYSSADVCQITGASYRQLDLWVRYDILRIPATGSGFFRRFNGLDLRVVQMLRRLADLSCPSEGLRKAADFLYEQLPSFQEDGWLVAELVDVAQASGGRWQPVDIRPQLLPKSTPLLLQNGGWIVFVPAEPNS